MSRPPPWGDTYFSARVQCADLIALNTPYQTRFDLYCSSIAEQWRCRKPPLPYSREARRIRCGGDGPGCRLYVTDLRKTSFTPLVVAMPGASRILRGFRGFAMKFQLYTLEYEQLA